MITYNPDCACGHEANRHDIGMGSDGCTECACGLGVTDVARRAALLEAAGACYAISRQYFDPIGTERRAVAMACAEECRRMAGAPEEPKP